MDSYDSDSDNYIQIPPLMQHRPQSKNKPTKQPEQPKSKAKPTKTAKTRVSTEAELTKKMKEHEKQISELRNQIQEDSDSFKYISTLNKTHEEYDKLVKSYEETIQRLKQNEQNLLEELQNQTVISKDALTKLYQFQQEYNIERDKLKSYYDDYIKEKEQEFIRRHELQIQQMHQGMKESMTNGINIQEIQSKLRDLQQKEELYLEQIEQLKNKLASKKHNHGSKELKQKLIDMELKMEQWDEGLDQMKHLEKENQKLLLKVNSYEKKLWKKDEKEKRLKEEWSKQYHDLQTEIKYWKHEMDKVIMENNVVLSKLTPQKKQY